MEHIYKFVEWYCESINNLMTKKLKFTTDFGFEKTGLLHMWSFQCYIHQPPKDKCDLPNTICINL